MPQTRSRTVATVLLAGSIAGLAAAASAAPQGAVPRADPLQATMILKEGRIGALPDAASEGWRMVPGDLRARLTVRRGQVLKATAVAPLVESGLFFIGYEVYRTICSTRPGRPPEPWGAGSRAQSTLAVHAVRTDGTMTVGLCVRTRNGVTGSPYLGQLLVEVLDPP